MVVVVVVEECGNAAVKILLNNGVWRQAARVHQQLTRQC